jgi:hypothetical protein
VKAEPSTFREDSTAKKLAPSRALAASMIIRAFVDYHEAKKLMFKKKITKRSLKNLGLSRLSNYEVETLLNGKSAWEWLSFPPIPVEMGLLTLNQCMDALGWDDKDVSELFKPEAFRNYMRAFGKFEAREAA